MTVNELTIILIYESIFRAMPTVSERSQKNFPSPFYLQRSSPFSWADADPDLIQSGRPLLTLT